MRRMLRVFPLVSLIALISCGGGSKPPAPVITVTVSPASANLIAGGTQQFTATVANAINTSVTWTLAGSGCTGAACGAISSTGLYTAPSPIPAAATVAVRATAVADTTKSGSATVTHTPVSVTVSPSGNVTVIGGATAQFTATVSNAPTGQGAVNWSVAGGGTVDSSGLYSAPARVSADTNATVTATSGFDTSKSASVTVALKAPVVTVSPTSASTIAGATQQFSATVVNAGNTAVTWSVAGTGCAGAACGTISSTGLYTAPSPIPALGTATIRATLEADTSKSGTAVVTHIPVEVSLSPSGSLSMISAETRQFTATVSNAPSGQTAVTWSVSGGGAIGSIGLYSAPAKVTADTNATVTATSAFDTSKSASVTIALKAPVVTVSPVAVSLDAGGATQRFAATVLNVPAGQNGVTWSVSGLGQIDTDGLYHSPALVPTAGTHTVLAASVFDDTKVGQASVSLTPLTLTVAPNSATLYSGQTQQFTAAVTHHLNKTVAWSLSGSDCAGASCGVVDTNGVYTAPPSIAHEMTVSVTATAAADPSKSAAATVTLIPVTVTVSPQTAMVGVNSSQQFTAVVAGTSNHSVNWAVSGSDCSGSLCGTISATGLYTAPATVPSSTVAVTATSVVDSTKAGTAIVTVTPSENTKLVGPYAFSYTGYDSLGRAYYVVGSFIADGNGALDVLIDTNGIAPFTKLTAYGPLTGTYEVYSGGNRGQLTIDLSWNPMTFRFSLSPSGDQGHMIRFDGNEYGSAIFKRQTPADFLLSRISGDYVLAFSGLSAVAGNRDALVGRFHTDGAGSISDAVADAATTGESPMNLTFGGSISTNWTRIDRGHGIMNVTVPGLGTRHFGFYMVNQDEMFVLSCDDVSPDIPLYIGSMVRQTGGPFSTASFTGTSVFYLIADASTSTAAVTIGQLDVNNGVGAAEYAQNWAGSYIVVGQHFNLTSTMAANGRGMWTLDNNRSNFVFYLVAPNTGYVLSYQAPSSSVSLGFFEPQSGAPFTAAAFSGDYYGGTVLAPTSGVGYGTGILTANGSGEWTATADVAGGGGPVMPDLSVSGTYAITSATTGSGTHSQTFPAAFQKVFYAVTPNKMLLIPIQPGVVNPGLEISRK